MRISDWSSDVCSSELGGGTLGVDGDAEALRPAPLHPAHDAFLAEHHVDDDEQAEGDPLPAEQVGPGDLLDDVDDEGADHRPPQGALAAQQRHDHHENRSEEHTPELQSLMRISYPVFCLPKTKDTYK